MYLNSSLFFSQSSFNCHWSVSLLFSILLFSISRSFLICLFNSSHFSSKISWFLFKVSWLLSILLFRSSMSSLSCFLNSSLFLSSFSFKNSLSSFPVSYTHLDVYKRQSLFSISSPFSFIF